MFAPRHNSTVPENSLTSAASLDAKRDCLASFEQIRAAIDVILAGAANLRHYRDRLTSDDHLAILAIQAETTVHHDGRRSGAHFLIEQLRPVDVGDRHCRSLRPRQTAVLGVVRVGNRHASRPERQGTRVRPPSTTMRWPVMNPAPSEARKLTA